MATTPVVTVRLEPELRERLDRLAKAQRRSRSFVATEAIREYVKVNEWQIEETRKALAEADAGRVCLSVRGSPRGEEVDQAERTCPIVGSRSAG